jgi:hypothetical protein
MATTTTNNGNTTQTSTQGSGGNKNINILNTGQGATITVGCCGDSSNSQGGGAAADDFQTKPSTEDCSGGKLIVLETGDTASTIATGYGSPSTLKSKLVSGIHTLQFAICSGPKTVDIPNGVENSAMNGNVQYESEWTDGKLTYTGDLLMGYFCLIRMKLTSDQAFVLRPTVYNNMGCGTSNTDCSHGIIDITTGSMTGQAAYDMPFTVTAGQGETAFALCQGEKKFTALTIQGTATDITIDGQSVGTTLPTLPFCATSIKVTGGTGVSATIKNEICGTECTECGLPQLFIPIAQFLNPTDAAISLEPLQVTAEIIQQYEITIQLPNIGDKDCLRPRGVPMNYATSNTLPAWDADWRSWKEGGTPQIGIQPTLPQDTTTIPGYKLDKQANKITLYIAILRRPTDQGKHIRVGGIYLGVCGSGQ